jgi:hypothetical protein
MKDQLSKEEELAAVLVAAAAFKTEDMWMVKFRCVCGKRIVEPFRYIGQKGYCRKCRRGVVVPEVEDESVLGLRCECGYDLPIELVRHGLEACVKCGRGVAIPKKKRHGFLNRLLALSKR